MTRPSIDQIKQWDHSIQAWAYLVDQEPKTEPTVGPLAHLRFGVKDVIDVRGMPTAFGARLENIAPARFDAACVALLRQTGAQPIGKTVTAEFAYAAPGPTRNPHNINHTPGGSSSGSAAAVAAGMVDFALGTQTGGSMIRPAAFNGVVGFKPGFGRVPRAGMHVLCDSLDTIGWFTPDVALSQLIAEVFMPPADERSATHTPLSVAVLTCCQLGAFSEDAFNCLQSASDALRDHGLSIDWLESAALEVETMEVHGRIMHYELARSLFPIANAEPQGLRAPTLEVIKEGLRISAAQYDELMSQRHRLQARWWDRLSKYDLILTLSAPGAAPLGFQSTGSSVFNRIWSLLGWPALHLPICINSAGLPLGVQCIAFPGQDTWLLHTAQALHPLMDRRKSQLILG